MLQYKNKKVKVCSLDGDTDYFDIVAGVLQGDTLAPYLFIICLDYVLRTSYRLKERRYPTQTITDVDYADDSASSKYVIQPKLNPCNMVWNKQQMA